MKQTMRQETKDVIVIGAGQAGLAMGYHLALRGIDFIILDAAKRVGDSWRSRWDSLLLFTPTEQDGLPGLPFPAPAGTYPTKDQMADYLELYAERFKLPIVLESLVRSLRRDAAGYAVETGAARYVTPRVVVAIGAYQVPFIPRFSADLSDDVIQLHSSQFRNAGQLRPGTVVVVGTGNSGVQIAMELSRTHKVYLSGRHNRHRPKHVFGRDIHSLPDALGATKIRLDRPWFRKLVKMVRNRLIASERRRTQGDRLVGLNLVKVVRDYGLCRAASATAARDRHLVFNGGDSIETDNVIWATGFQWDAPWIELPVLDENSVPDHDGGIAVGAPGIYFLGLRYLRRFNSSLVGGVGRDAAFIAEHIASSSRA